MIRLALLILLITGPAFAQQQCPGSIQTWSWGIPFPPFQWGFYDLTPAPGISAGALSVAYTTLKAETFIGVPQSVAQNFQYSSNPPQFFNNQIKPVYHELLLLEKSNCPLLLQSTGALWTK
jgi:hypothetical protein